MLYSLQGSLALTTLFLLLVTPFIVKWLLPSCWNRHFLSFYLGFILLSIFYWLIAAASFLFYYTSISINNEQHSLLYTAAAYIFSWGIGNISVFAPQGIGVFEVVAGKLLPLPMTLGGAVAFIAGFRIIALAADSITWISHRSYLFFFPRIATDRK